MHPPFSQLSKDYHRIAKAIYFLEKNFQRQPELKTTAAAAGLSDYHFQRIFKRWAGLSPKKFLQFLTKEHAKNLLKNSNLLDVSYAAGLSGPGRLHDLFITWEAMSPGEYKQQGQGLTIAYGFHATPLGECFIALTERGICGLSFTGDSPRAKVLKTFHKDWKNARLRRDQRKTEKYIKRIFAAWRPRQRKAPLNILWKGTNFQMKVWEALLKIPSGAVVTYKTVARWIGCPRAVRAVGNAVGKNPVAYLIPCHRVIRNGGQWGGYRWGVTRKKALIVTETALPPNL